MRTVAMLHDDDDDMLFADELLQDSSQESLIHAAQHLLTTDDDLVSRTTAPSSPPNVDLDGVYEDSSNCPPCPEPGHDAPAGSHDRDSETEVPQVRHGSGAYVDVQADHHKVEGPTIVENEEVIAKIERVFETVVDALLAERAGATIVLDACSSTSPDDELRPRSLSFPGKTAEEAWRFSTVHSFAERVSIADNVQLL